MKTFVIHCPGIGGLDEVLQNTLEDALSYALEYGDDLEEGIANGAYLFHLSDQVGPDGPTGLYSGMEKERYWNNPDMFFVEKGRELNSVITQIARLNGDTFDAIKNYNTHSSLNLLLKLPNLWVVSLEVTHAQTHQK